MKTKLVLWGSNAQDSRVLIALELRPEENMVNIFTFPEEVATEEFSQTLLKEWRNNDPIDFPEGYVKTEKELSMSESLLPEDLKVERPDIIQRAQTEWHFIVLSSKLYISYQGELEDLKDKVSQLSSYSTEMWDMLKAFWDKVQVQVRDRNLLKEHANELRDNTNTLFSQMKELRAKLDEEFHKLSQNNHDKFMGNLEEIERKVKEGVRLQPIFDELKSLQRSFRDAKFTREHRSKVWERLDSAFKKVKEKRFGPGANDDRSPLERINRRYEGLLAAIEKMERSIRRDQEDLEFQNKKIALTDGQLEAQIRQAKIKMIEERIRSKEEKLGEMLQTKKELEKRIEVQKEKESKRQEKEKLDELRKEAEKKIREEIQAQAQARKNEENKLEKAAEAISQSQSPSETKEEGMATEPVEVQKEAAVEPENQEQQISTPELESQEQAPAAVDSENQEQQQPVEEPEMAVEEVTEKEEEEKQTEAAVVAQEEESEAISETTTEELSVDQEEEEVVVEPEPAEENKDGN